MRSIKRLFKKYADSETSTIETDLIHTYFDRLNSKGIKIADVQSNLVLNHRIHQKINQQLKPGFLQRIKPFLPIAASLLLLLSISLTHYFYFDKPTESWLSHHANKGEQLDFYLSDSTQVYLSPGSTLKYTAVFGDQDRKVYLDGEAFFKVRKKNNHQAFVVESTHLVVNVLGTEFNVQDIEGEITAVHVHSGKVKVNGKENNQQQIVTANQQVVYNKTSGLLTKTALADGEINSWFTGQIRFKSASLTEVINTLKRRFNVEITLKTETLPTYPISGDFTNDSIEEVLKSLNFLYGITYVKIDEKHIEISIH